MLASLPAACAATPNPANATVANVISAIIHLVLFFIVVISPSSFCCPPIDAI
jgi:hypothetical protein